MSILNYLHFKNPTAEQEKVLLAMQDFISNEFDFLILSGAAGTGKTSITSALIGYLNELNRTYRIAAPTGRAARIIGRKANTVTSTIHSLIYNVEVVEKSGKVIYSLKTSSSSIPTIYIIDEASMISEKKDVSNELFHVDKGMVYDLIEYIMSENTGNKIIFIGDHYQLPPINEIESVALSKQFLESTFNLKGSEFYLTEVKRQEDGSYILENATNIRKAIDDGKINHEIKGKKSDGIWSAAQTYVKDAESKGFDNQVAIGVSHRANKYFNDIVREKMFGKLRQILEPGDLLMVTQNWSRNGSNLYNGDHVQLISVDWNLQETVAGLHFVAVKVKPIFGDSSQEIEDYAIVESIVNIGGKVDPTVFNELRMNRYAKNIKFRESQKVSDDRYLGALKLMYGHAITCNKAQGGEWKKVFINTLGIPSLKWQYTAVTRGIDEIEKF
jgi:ATP-dependent exoDNAse (exonuclease V) alpha subunit